MTAVSLINPYAPQPAQTVLPETGLPATQTTTPVQGTATNNTSGGASDQSGSGAGNGSATGDAQLAALVEKGRDGIAVQRPTPKSVVEAQSTPRPAEAFLERQARAQVKAQAARDADAAEQAAKRAADAKAEADAAARPEFEMPNPLPTAPILQRDDA